MVSIVQKRKPPDGKSERQIITGLIISTEYCKAVLPVLEPTFKLLDFRPARTIARWISSYFVEYGERAPLKYIQDIFEQEKRKLDKRDPTHADSIAKFLASLSDEYSQRKEAFNASYEIDRAEKYLEKQYLEEKKEKLDGLLKNGLIEEAKKVFQDFSPLRLPGKNLLMKLEANIISFSDFTKEKIESPESIISPWLTDGSLSMIYGPRGIGKTWLSSTIAVVVTRKHCEGIEIGPWTVEAGSGVLYVDGEMREHDMWNRIKLLSRPLGDESKEYPSRLLSANRFAAKYREQISLSNELWRQNLYEYLSKHEEYHLLILDNIAALAPGLEEKSKKDWDPVNQWLLSLRHLGVSVILIHHAGKDEKRGPRGTSGQVDALDCVLRLSKPKGYKPEEGAFFSVQFEKARNIEPGAKLRAFALRIARDDERGGVTWRAEDVKGSANRDAVMGLLIDGKWNQTQIASVIGISQGRVAQIKKEAKTMGYFDSRGKATEEGLEVRREMDLSIYYGTEDGGD